MKKMKATEAFVETIVEDIDKYLEEAGFGPIGSIAVKDITKASESYLGLVINKAGSPISVSLDLDMFYSQFINEELSYKEIFHRISKAAMTPCPVGDINWMLDYQEAKKHFIIRAHSKETCWERIKNFPHRELAKGILLTVSILVNQTSNGCSTTTVDKDLLKHWNVTEEQLFKDAIEVSPTVAPVKIQSLSESIGLPEDPGMPPVLIVTNEKNNYGAASIFYPGIIKQLAERMGGGFIALPSSIHEWLIMPDDGQYDMFNQMVNEVNSESVDPTDRLGTCCYRYHEDSIEPMAIEVV
ncbi:MAG: hypothetical protein IKT20_01255 [Clostridiales bacterium]|nr:hypothetical protein [Clostridiales bacterium]